MDIRSTLAAQSYDKIQGVNATKTEAKDPVISFASEFVETIRNGEDSAKAAMIGKADAHSVVEALAATELAVETAVTVRNKVVEAYQEILRMPV
jgi:flagellar hook-basal body complex protein FliE